MKQELYNYSIEESRPLTEGKKTLARYHYTTNINVLV